MVYHTAASLTVAIFYFPCCIATWSMVAGEGRAVFLAERIASAQHFDIDEIADKSSPYPHMLPSEREFEEHVGKVDIDRAQFNVHGTCRYMHSSSV